MLCERINLRSEKTEHGFMPSVMTYILDKDKSVRSRPMMVVCPGGGYGGVAEDWEGERIALAFTAQGFCAVSLDYCVSPHRYPEGLLDVAAAIKLCRDNAREWQIDPEKIAVIGFSAGGHLVSDISNAWKNEELFGAEAVKSRIYRPDYAILSYPVITAGEHCHEGSFINLTGSKDRAMWQEHSTENSVSADTPPTFIWHTYEDQLVPVESSLLYAEALRRNNVPFELHIYDRGDHGLSLSTQRLYRNKPLLSRKYNWVTDCTEWLCRHFEERE